MVSSPGAVRILPFLATTISVAVLAAGCRVEFGARGEREDAGEGHVVRVYTSIYKEVIDALEPALERRLAATSPGTRVEWFQSGSEKVATRLDAEFASGGSPCDLLLTSDPGYYARLKDDGRLVPYVSPAALKQPRSFVDPDGAWAVARLSTMVIGVSPKAERRPETFGELATGPWRVTIGDPLSSGTYLSTVSALSGSIGWDWFRRLKAKGTVASGGNASVLQRLENGEAEAGVVLLETLLAAKSRGSGVAIVFPADGGVVVPGPIALLTHARRSEAARAVYDAFLSDDVQRLIVEKGYMHSPDPALPPPTGSPPLERLLAARPAVVGTTASVKRTFDEIFFR